MVTPSRLFLVYLVVESAALVALLMTIGFGRTLLLVVGSFTAGMLLAGSQLRAQVRRLLAGRPDGAFGDGALVALGTLLVVVPGLVSTVVGLLMLLPATRPVVRGVAGDRPSERYRETRPGDFIDGQVIDGQVIDGEVIDVSAAPTP